MENKANAELVEFLSELLGIARSMVIIRHGATGRRKVVEVAGGPELTAKLEAIAGRSTIHDPRSTPTSR
ncbi:hypothetical protein D3C83_138760 [compost metagenome]